MHAAPLEEDARRLRVRHGLRPLYDYAVDRNYVDTDTTGVSWLVARVHTSVTRPINSVTNMLLTRVNQPSFTIPQLEFDSFIVAKLHGYYNQTLMSMCVSSNIRRRCKRCANALVCAPPRTTVIRSRVNRGKRSPVLRTKIRF